MENAIDRMVRVISPTALQGDGVLIEVVGKAFPLNARYRVTLEPLADDVIDITDEEVIVRASP